MVPTDTLPPLRRGRKIDGMSAILLPMKSTTEPNWAEFRKHVQKTVNAGLVPAVNMDTGYGNLLNPNQRQEALDIVSDVCQKQAFVAGVFVRDQPGDKFQWDEYRKSIDPVIVAGGLPIIFQSFGLTEQTDDQIVNSYRQIGEHAGKFLAFELGKMFAPFGSIYSLDVYQGLLNIASCVGAKHSSLNRQLEWQRIQLRDRLRPEFKVLTGNDLAIDMVMYGSDYLLGLSTFAPDFFALRDKLWQAEDARFYELNDLLQYLGFFAFRSPVPAYKHTAAQFLKLAGNITTDFTFPGSPTRPASDTEILMKILEQFESFQGVTL